MIILCISIYKYISRLKTDVFQGMQVIKFLKSFLCVPVKIPDGMIQIEEDMVCLMICQFVNVMIWQFANMEI